jgi:hypothetical protein
MTGHFVIEADRTVVGVAVRVPGGFQFFSSDKDFRSLEGKVFRRARGLVHRAAQLASRLRKRGPGEAANVAGAPT